jgi:hypothetical protein
LIDTVHCATGAKPFAYPNFPPGSKIPTRKNLALSNNPDPYTSTRQKIFYILAYILSRKKTEGSVRHEKYAQMKS